MIPSFGSDFPKYQEHLYDFSSTIIVNVIFCSKFEKMSIYASFYSSMQYQVPFNLHRLDFQSTMNQG